MLIWFIFIFLFVLFFRNSFLDGVHNVLFRTGHGNIGITSVVITSLAFQKVLLMAARWWDQISS